MYPHLGKAYTAYAKSVKPVHIQPAAPPDAGLLFDGSPVLIITDNSCPRKKEIQTTSQQNQQHAFLPSNNHHPRFSPLQDRI
jgi:linoleate 10R-lipoxygenase